MLAELCVTVTWTCAQAADLGIGVMGKEGRQATNNADFAISQFRRASSLPSAQLCRAHHTVHIVMQGLSEGGLATGDPLAHSYGGGAGLLALPWQVA